MKNLFIVCVFTGMFALPAIGQDGVKDELSPATANPKARALMKEDFFWSTIDGSGPFGSDDGWEAAHGFCKWRREDTSTSPIEYLTDLITSFGYPAIAWDEMDTSKLVAYMRISIQPSEQLIEQMVQMDKQEQARDTIHSPNKKILTEEQLRQIAMNAGKNMGLTYLVGIDEAIIGTAFAQIVMEGRLDPKLRYYVTKALEREMLPVITRNFGDADRQNAHVEKMRKMLFVVSEIK